MDITTRKAKIQKWATVGLIGLAGLIVSPIVFLAIKGLVGLAIAAVLGLAIVTFTPWVSMKFANWRVKAIMHEAGENPIETMINLLVAKREAFETFKENVTNAVTARDSFKQKCQEFAKKYPARANEFNQQLANMTELVERKKQALADAQQTLEVGQHKLEEMKAYWDMSQAAQEANRAAGMDTGDLYEKLKADTAVDAVFESMNKAFAQLEVAAALDDAPGISYNKAETLEITVDRKQKVMA
jgi:ribosome-binding protein aMBF1 (putative translation factor)